MVTNFGVEFERSLCLLDWKGLMKNGFELKRDRYGISRANTNNYIRAQENLDNRKQILVTKSCMEAGYLAFLTNFTPNKSVLSVKTSLIIY